ncbi:hypothetical protein AHiyo8_12290 [Arthrobacter sp. Hiyo8]|nr:hypothetical protein AHiyo8_12290 [Arthrobacter sp. Hiyo8]
MMIEVEIVGVRIELPSNQPLVLLREMHGNAMSLFGSARPKQALSPWPSKAWCRPGR